MSHSSPKSRVVVLTVVLLVAAGAALLAWRWMPRPRTGAPVAPPAAAPRALATLPGFVLEDQRGQSVGLDDLRGGVWIAAFVFTRCVGPCPLIMHRVAELSREVASSAELSDVRFVLFSVDPEFDRPAVLEEYGRTHGVDPARTTFLTGTTAAVRGLVRHGFKLPVLEQDDPLAPIVHSQNLVLVDRRGRVRGTFDALEDNGGELRRMLAVLLAEQPTADVYVPGDVAHPAWLEARRAEQVAAAASSAAPHDFQFTDRVGASGITFWHTAIADTGKFYRATHYDHGTALAVADVDGDGQLDLYFVNQVGRNGLYRGLGDGRFEDITDRAGVGVGDRATVGASFADVDNDGDADLFVTAVRAENLLFANDGQGRFTDITSSAGVGGDPRHSSGAIFFDYDGDGLLDLFVTRVGKYTGEMRHRDGRYVSFPDAFSGHLRPERSETSVLYRNLGSGRFEDVSTRSGLVHSAWSGDATAFDYDDDGDPDLYVPSMQGHDELWQNLGGGRFVRDERKVFPATPWGAMGVEVLDWNGDGRLDLYVTDMHTDMSTELQPEEEKRKHDPRTMFPPRFLATDGKHILGNALFTHRGGRAFAEQSDAANAETGWPWGPSAGDLNADGWPDLFVTGGMCYPFRYGTNSVLLNEQGRRFADAEFVLGVEPRARLVRPWFELDCDGEDAPHDICKGEVAPVLRDTPAERARSVARQGHVTVWAARGSRSSAILDLDGDGDLDIVTNEYHDAPQVWISDLAQRRPIRFLTVRLLGRDANRDGLGAVVTVQAAGRAQVQVHDGKAGYLGQSLIPLYFGLGDAPSADSISVRWPHGRTQVQRGPFASGSAVVVTEQP